MTQTLYRKYRPQAFGDLTNQNHVKITLQRSVASGKISHAYLFTGPRGIGKTTAARIFAKAVNCLQPQDGEPCNQCDICQAINKGNFLDLVELDAASRRKIDEIKEFKELIKYRPNVARYKVFIIDEVHMLTDVSFNALLKTIEEPPEYAIFILCTTVVHKIPETIISRCQRYDFKKIPTQDIVANLQHIADQEKVKVDEAVLETVAHLSEGCLRDAQSLFGQILSLGETTVDLDTATLLLPHSNYNYLFTLWQYCVTGDLPEALRLIDKIYNEGVDMDFFMDEYLKFHRFLLLYKVSPKINYLKELFSSEQYDGIIKLLENVTVTRLQHDLEILIAKTATGRLVEIKQLPLELAVIEIVETKKPRDDEEQNPPPSHPVPPPAQTPRSRPAKAPDRPAKTASTDKSERIKKSEQDKLVAALQQSNYTLSQIIKNAQLSISGSELLVTVGLPIHLSQLKRDKNLQVLDELFISHFNRPLKTRPEYDADVVIETEKKQEQMTEHYVDDVVKVFGGQVIETGIIEE